MLCAISGRKNFLPGFFEFLFLLRCFRLLDISEAAFRLKLPGLLFQDPFSCFLRNIQGITGDIPGNGTSAEQKGSQVQVVSQKME